MEQFIESKIHFSDLKPCYLTPAQIMDEFKRNGHHAPSETLFFKELRNQMNQKHPDIAYKKINGIRRYDRAYFDE